MKKKHKHSAFFVDFFFELLCLTQITNSCIKTIAKSASNWSESEKNVSCHVLLSFVFHVFKKGNWAQHLRNSLGLHK